MKNKILYFLFSLILTTNLFAQEGRKAIQTTNISSLNDAAEMAESIVKAAGLNANFAISEANVPNAMAVIYQGKRFVFYNPRFISLLTRATGTKWAAISVLAHEIGHHLYSPSVNRGKLQLATELEADQFSGYVLQKMGASLSEAEAAMKVLGTSYATSTHPARAVRLNSIEKGWKNAGGVEEPVENTWARNENTQSEQRPSIRYNQRTESQRPSYEVAASIHFNAKPDINYYVTTRMNVVKVEDEEVTIIAKIKKSNDNEFPYIIYDDTGYRVYVDSFGMILNENGRVVGKMNVEKVSS